MRTTSATPADVQPGSTWTQPVVPLDDCVPVHVPAPGDGRADWPSAQASTIVAPGGESLREPQASDRRVAF